MCLTELEVKVLTDTILEWWSIMMCKTISGLHSMPYEETYFRGCPVSMFKDLLHSLNKVTIP